MTTVERHQSTHHLLSDAAAAAAASNNSHKVARRIPPAVPSPPRHHRDESPNRQGSNSNLTHSRRERGASVVVGGGDDSNMALEEQNQWYFTEAELASTPSILSGIAPSDERCRRAKGVNFIIQAGIMLKLPQLTLATASVFFHRYFMRVSMDESKGGTHHYALAATSLFLATKTEENCRKTREVVIAVVKVAQKNPKMVVDEQDKEYWRWKDIILTLEESMLEKLTFDVVVTPPYTYLWQFLHQLRVEESKPLRNAAWAFINDSCLTPLCLLIPSKDIAIASVYFAAKSTKEPIADDQNGNPWWEQLGGSLENIAKALNVMNDFWTENPLNRSDTPWIMSPLNDENDQDKTRKGRVDGSGDQTPSPGERRNSASPQNGYSQRNSGSINGNGTAEHSRGQRSPVNPRDIPAPTTESDNPNENDGPKIVEPSGSSDAALKEAANDPATHEHTNSDGLKEPQSLKGSPKATPKRKSGEADLQEPLAKRAKAEESEEGEVEA